MAEVVSAPRDDGDSMPNMAITVIKNVEENKKMFFTRKIAIYSHCVSHVWYEELEKKRLTNGNQSHEEYLNATANDSGK